MLEYDLPLLASTAAIAIEFHLNSVGEKKYYDYVSKLAEKVDKFSKKEYDEFNMGVPLLESFWPDSKDWNGRVVDDIYLHANLLAKDLRCFTELSRERQEELRDVCIRISDRAALATHSYRFGLVA